jgi:DNA polymerase elongation subunit (family B)
MYRNIVYSNFNKDITLWTWDIEGNRITEKYPFKPYLYVEDANGKDGISLYNTPLRKVEFSDKKARDHFCLSNLKTYGNLPPTQQFLIDKYHGQNKKSEFSLFPLKIYSLDIETFSENGFPDPKIANDTITLISVHNSIDNTIHTFGLANDYNTSDDRVFYKCFENEEELLKAFIRFWRKDFCDVVTGWFCDGFDIPYICNRINKIYNDPEACNKLSPTGRVWKQDNAKKRLQDYEQLWNIEGITILDYQYVYKVFTKDKRESYSLNAICEEELGTGKLKYDAISLSHLAKQDWHKFVDYNIQDVQLLVQLEDKLKYLKICRELAYNGLAPFSTSTSTTTLVTGVVAQKALEQNKIIPTFVTKEFKKFEGGFVKEPQVGLQKSLLYYDVDSLYPNTMVALNISPETKLGKIVRKDIEKDEYDIITTSGKKYTLNKQNLDYYLKKERVSISKSDVLFTQKFRGIFSNIVEENYKQRVEIKNKIKELKKELNSLKNP